MANCCCPCYLVLTLSVRTIISVDEFGMHPRNWEAPPASRQAQSSSTAKMIFSNSRYAFSLRCTGYISVNIYLEICQTLGMDGQTSVLFTNPKHFLLYFTNSAFIAKLQGYLGKPGKWLMRDSHRWRWKINQALEQECYGPMIDKAKSHESIRAGFIFPSFLGGYKDPRSQVA